VRILARVLFLAVLVVICLAAWVGIRGWLAKDHLEASADLVSRLQTQLEEGSTGPAQDTVTRMQHETADAVRLTGDPVWRAATHLPGVGDDLSAVHQVAVSGHTLSTDALPSIAAAAAQVEVLRGGAGQSSPAQLVAAAKRLQAPLRTANAGVTLARSQISSVDPAGLTGPVRTGVDQLDSGLGTLQRTLASLIQLDGVGLKASAAAGA
jgi:hypothetical protein